MNLGVAALRFVPSIKSKVTKPIEPTASVVFASTSGLSGLCGVCIFLNYRYSSIISLRVPT